VAFRNIRVSTAVPRPFLAADVSRKAREIRAPRFAKVKA